MPVGFKTFGQAALFYIPLANGAEYVLLIIDFLLSPFVCPSIQYTFYSFHWTRHHVFSYTLCTSTIQYYYKVSSFQVYFIISLKKKKTYYMIWKFMGSNIDPLLYSFIQFVKRILVNNSMSNKLFVVFDIQQHFFLNNL